MKNHFKKLILLITLILSASTTFAQTTDIVYKGQLQSSSALHIKLIKLVGSADPDSSILTERSSSAAALTALRNQNARMLEQIKQQAVRPKFARCAKI